MEKLYHKIKSLDVKGFKFEHLIWLGFFATVTNRWVLGIIPFAVAYFIFFLKACRNKKFLISLNPLHQALIALLCYVTLSALLYKPEQFLSVGFYRNDANLFISYGLFFGLYLASYQFRNSDNLFFIFFSIVTTSNTVYLVYVFFLDRPYWDFRGLYRSTSAFGGFLAILSAFVVYWKIEARKKWYKLSLLTLFLILLLASESRTSILSLILSTISVLAINSKFRPLRWAPVILLVTLTTAFFFSSSINQYLYGKESPSILGNLLSKDEGKKNNLSKRLTLYWPKAVEGFFHAPVAGMGFGSYNDYLYCVDNRVIQYLYTGKYLPNADYSDYCGTIQGFEEEKEKTIAITYPEHAHNSFFHVLFELGLLGLALFILFWALVYRIIWNEVGRYKNSLLCCFWVVLFSSLAGHKLTTPAVIMPFCLLLFICKYASLSSENEMEARPQERVKSSN